MITSESTQFFNHGDVFPIIARVIKQRSELAPDTFVSHDEIVKALIADTQGAHQLEVAYRRARGTRSVEWFAGNMIAWFSQKYTTGESPYCRRFERQKWRAKWGYRPIS